ncbi:MAG: F0F1 ATP synthase subunit epsilon [Flavobacteriaceae bacterium]|jgi:F-type H+-transporting ATPase subunit epsilon|tara:strand:- start:16250 stop:16528 length:279 start_codon:yes stop_codon:yes gene_type:complete
MYLEIVSPEATLYTGEISSISAPGKDGFFQILSAHAALVASLGTGEIKLQGVEAMPLGHASKFTALEKGVYTLSIQSGTLEVKNNKIIVLAD